MRRFEFFSSTMFKPILPKYESAGAPLNTEQYIRTQLAKVATELKSTHSVLKQHATAPAHLELVKHLECYVDAHSKMENMQKPNQYLHHAKHGVVVIVAFSTGALFIFAVLLIHALIKFM
jgi:hypothetical protein